MAKRLQKKSETEGESGTKLRLQQMPFRVCFDTALDNNYELKDMTLTHVAAFHRFISDTVYKKLTVSQVDAQFLRAQGDAPALKRGDYELIHYGKARNPFRIFGYYNNDGYFSICRIDGNHETNKE